MTIHTPETLASVIARANTENPDANVAEMRVVLAAIGVRGSAAGMAIKQYFRDIHSDLLLKDIDGNEAWSRRA